MRYTRYSTANDVMKEFLILLAMTAAIMAMSLKKFNDKLE